MPDHRGGFAVVHHVDGPRVRLGVLWFASTVVAALMAAAAALGAGQLVVGADAGVGRTARRLAAAPPAHAAVVGAAALPLAAAAGADTLGAALAALVVVALVHRLVTPAPTPAAVDVGRTLAAAWSMGLAAAAPVLALHLGEAVAVVLLLLLAAYDAGDFLVGAGARRPWEGPLAGVTAATAVVLLVVVAAPAPLGVRGAALLGAAAAVLAPLGPPAASVLIGGGADPARFVRRLDSLLVAGPLWAFAAAALLPAT